MEKYRKTLFGFKKEGSNKKYHRKIINMPIEQLDAAMDFLTNKIQNFTPQNGYGVLLYVFYTKDRQEGEAKLLKFSNYSWEECSGYISLTPKQITLLLD